MIVICEGCGKMISISKFPAGNPIAVAYPKKFRMLYATCGACKSTYCDLCVSKAKGGCPNCGGPVELEGLKADDPALRSAMAGHLPFRLNSFPPRSLVYALGKIWLFRRIDEILVLFFFVALMCVVVALGGKSTPWGHTLSIVGLAGAFPFVALFSHMIGGQLLGDALVRKRRMDADLPAALTRAELWISILFFLLILGSLVAFPAIAWWRWSPWLIAYVFMVFYALTLGSMVRLYGDAHLIRYRLSTPRDEWLY